MSSNSTFPSPVGGVPYPIDFAPSITFAVLYGLLIPITLSRAFNSRTRCLALLGTTIFSIERVIFFSLRAHAANSAGARESTVILVYFQATLGSGMISIAADLTNIIRAVLVESTLGSNMRAKYRKSSKLYRKSHPQPPGLEEAIQQDANYRPDGFMSPLGVEEEAALEDYPQPRKLIRTACMLGWLIFQSILGLSGTVGGLYKLVPNGGVMVTIIQILRYATTASAVLMIFFLWTGTLWAYLKIPRVPKVPVALVVFITALLTCVADFRLVQMDRKTTSILSTAVGSQNTASEKVLFYVFHMAPEYICIATLTLTNVRKVFKTGIYGDLINKDPF